MGPDPGAARFASLRACPCYLMPRLRRLLNDSWLSTEHDHGAIDDSDIGPWTLDLGRWTLDIGRWTLDVEPLELQRPNRSLS